MADITVTAANVSLVSGSAKHGTAGETITAGQSVYLKAADSEIYKADANDTAAKAQCVGIALNGASDGQPITYAGTGCVVDMGGTVAVGSIYVVSATPGGVTADAVASASYTTVIGIGTTALNIKIQLNISGVQVP